MTHSLKLYHVVAMSENRIIGNKGKLPWHFSADLKHFKKLTMGETLIMGRKTFESIGEKPLPGRENFILTHSKRAGKDHLKFFSSLGEALRAVKTKKAFVIGGASLYQETLKRVDGIYLTKIEGPYPGDTYYPEIPGFFKEMKQEVLQENPRLEVIFYEKSLS